VIPGVIPGVIGRRLRVSERRRYVTVISDRAREADAALKARNLRLLQPDQLASLLGWRRSTGGAGGRTVRISGAALRPLSHRRRRALARRAARIATSTRPAGLWSVARDLGLYGIRVNAIARSLFSTGITAGLPEAYGSPDRVREVGSGDRRESDAQWGSDPARLRPARCSEVGLELGACARQPDSETWS